MAQVVYRGNLSAKSFPFVSENFGRSIIVSGPDQNFSRQLVASEDNDKDIGIPQVYYCHNVMPHGQGFQSVGYTSILPAVTGVSNFTNIYLLRDGSDSKVYMGLTATGDAWISDGTGAPWVFKQNFAAGKLVTIAYVAGITYIYVANTGCYKYNFATGAFVSVTLTSLTAVNIIGITYSAGYLIAWSNSTVSWSSTIDPTDFTPSLNTGAGGGAVESARGAINYCVPHTLGFIVGTTDNCVAALYQNNNRYPFQFREIVNSGGMTSLDLVTWDANSPNLYAYTTSGVQLISTQQTQTIYPEITDFVSGRYFEDFDETLNTFSTTVLNTAMQKKIEMVSDRYFIVSYGISELTHAIVFDLALKRYGKLKITHVAAFTYKLVTSGILETPRQSLGFLKKDGSVSVVDFSIGSPGLNGVLLLGKYQYARSRTLQLDQIELESIRSTQSFSISVLTTYDGKTTALTTSPYLASAVGLNRTYTCRPVGINHSLLLKGGFMIDSVVLTFNIHGKR
jgi:hypothetical protein